MQQVIALSRESPSLIREAVEEILSDPSEGGAIVRRKLSRAETKTMVILPSSVSDYYARKAKEAGVSKADCMATVLKIVARLEDDQ